MSGVAPADLAACRNLLRHGSKSFFAASLLLPRHVREPATALYAFCRVADDAVDQTDDPVSALATLNLRLDRIYLQRPADDPVDRALAAVVQDFRMPRQLLDALLEGFAWDAANRRYDDLSGVIDYSARVAGTVGAMMTVLMGGRAPATLARACDLGIAMQLTNIARDVGEDARNGRLYLPLDWMKAEGIDPEAWLKAPVFDARIGRIVQQLLAEASVLYARSRDGVAALPSDCRPAIHAARLVYAEIGRNVTANGHDSVSQRAYVTGRRKLALLAEAMVAARGGSSGQPHALLPEVRFLVEAVTRVSMNAEERHVSEQFSGSRTSRVLDIFAKLERNQTTRNGIRPDRFARDRFTREQFARGGL